MDILDTSVIRGMRARDILALCASRHVAVSPFSLWEILCHLDETRQGESAEQAFYRRRGHVALLRSLDILDDPFAQHAADVGAIDLTNPTRFQDRDVARHVVERVTEVSSLAELHQQTYTHPDGTRGTFQNIAANARAALVEEEKRYIGNAQKLWERICDDQPFVRPSDLPDNVIWDWLREMLTALAKSYRQDGVVNDDLFIDVCQSMYPYFGYLLCRLRSYDFADGEKLAIPQNDTEDGYICMHLRLFNHDVLVTGDEGTRTALRQALDLWDANVPSAPARCNVLTLEDYRDLAREARTREAAYYNWRNRGCPIGDDWHDWFQAERYLEP